MRARQTINDDPLRPSPNDYRRMPWKNGGGHTMQIASHPADADLASFVWRVSVAEVTQDGPFSPFAGVDRTLVLLTGAGMKLAGDSEPMELRTPFEPLSFSGDEALHCSLVGGPVRDFNLMVRRGAALGNVVVRREGGEPIPPAGHVRLLCGAWERRSAWFPAIRPIALR
jgi:environmental stress-induced protein Ves